MKVCFGVISIGELYTNDFNKFFKPSLVAYTTKYGYDLKVFTETLDPAQNHPETVSFQKCLVPGSLLEYDWVVVLDADIYIEKDAPPISSLFANLGHRIGMVDETCQYTDKPPEYYKKSGFDIDTNIVLNTGMMICSPKHSAVLKSIYDKYISQCVGHPRKFHFEQSCIGYELQTQDMVCLVPRAWNYIYIYKLPEPKYFVHFAAYTAEAKRFLLSIHLAKSRFRWGIH